MKKVKVNHQPEKGLNGHGFPIDESDENELDTDPIGTIFSQPLDCNYRMSRPIAHDGFDSDEAVELGSGELLCELGEEHDNSAVDDQSEDEGPIRIIPFNMKEEEEDNDITKDDIWLDGTTKADIRKVSDRSFT